MVDDAESASSDAIHFLSIEFFDLCHFLVPSRLDRFGMFNHGRLAELVNRKLVFYQIWPEHYGYAISWALLSCQTAAYVR